MSVAQYRPSRSMLLLVASLTVFWGFNWPVMKVVMTEMAPLHFRSWCLSVGALGLFAMARLGGLPIRVPRGAWGRLALMSVFNIAAWNVFAIYGVRMLESGRAAILGYTFPVWGVLFSVWLLREPLTGRRQVGLALGIIGMALLLGTEFAAASRSPLGAVLMVASAVCWAIGTVIMKRWPVDLPTSSLTAWQMAITVVPIFAWAALVEDGSFSPLALSTWPFWGLVYNVFVCFIFCYWAWMKIATVAPVAISSLSTLMIPVAGVFSGMLVLGERPQLTDYAALACVVAALAIVLRPAPPVRASR